MTEAPLTPDYRTPLRPLSFGARHFPTLVFYARTLRIVCAAAWHTRQGYSAEQWARDSLTFIREAEASGLSFIIENTRAFIDLPGPCVIVANHMSTMETFALPQILARHRPISFVLKKSLTTYPIFGHVVNASQPIAVGRVNPREDFTIIMEQGQERLKNGISVVVFPQTTRQANLDRTAFNTIGTKLAKKAGVPVLPLAVKTDAWGVGKCLKDYGPIRPELPVHFCFGEPLQIRGTGKNEHGEIMEFIAWKLAAWRTI